MPELSPQLQPPTSPQEAFIQNYDMSPLEALGADQSESLKKGVLPAVKGAIDDMLDKAVALSGNRQQLKQKLAAIATPALAVIKERRFPRRKDIQERMASFWTNFVNQPPLNGITCTFEVGKVIPVPSPETETPLPMISQEKWHTTALVTYALMQESYDQGQITRNNPYLELEQPGGVDSRFIEVLDSEGQLISLTEFLNTMHHYYFAWEEKGSASNPELLKFHRYLLQRMSADDTKEKVKKSKKGQTAADIVLGEFFGSLPGQHPLVEVKEKLLEKLRKTEEKMNRTCLAIRLGEPDSPQLSYGGLAGGNFIATVTAYDRQDRGVEVEYSFNHTKATGKQAQALLEKTTQQAGQMGQDYVIPDQESIGRIRLNTRFHEPGISTPETGLMLPRKARPSSPLAVFLTERLPSQVQAVLGEVVSQLPPEPVWRCDIPEPLAFFDNPEQQQAFTDRLKAEGLALLQQPEWQEKIREQILAQEQSKGFFSRLVPSQPALDEAALDQKAQEMTAALANCIFYPTPAFQALLFEEAAIHKLKLPLLPLGIASRLEGRQEELTPLLTKILRQEQPLYQTNEQGQIIGLDWSAVAALRLEQFIESENAKKGYSPLALLDSTLGNNNPLVRLFASILRGPVKKAEELSGPAVYYAACLSTKDETFPRFSATAFPPLNLTIQVNQNQHLASLKINLLEPMGRAIALTMAQETFAQHLDETKDDTETITQSLSHKTKALEKELEAPPTSENAASQLAKQLALASQEHLTEQFPSGPFGPTAGQLSQALKSSNPEIRLAAAQLITQTPELREEIDQFLANPEIAEQIKRGLQVWYASAMTEAKAVISQSLI